MRNTRRLLYLAMLTALAPAWLACSDSLTGPDAASEDRTALRPLSPQSAMVASLQTTPAGYIRIGVVPSATSIELGSTDAFTMTAKESGAVLFSGEGAVQVDLLTAGTVRTRFWLQTACTGNEAFRDAWIGDAQAHGYETRIEFVAWAGCWRLILGTMPPDAGWTPRVAYKNEVISLGLAQADAFWRKLTTVTGETQLRVEHDGDERVVTQPVVLESAAGLVTIDGATYRGKAEVWTNSGGTLAGINELPLEEYLYGVVPRELPPGPYGLPEAQKAQAVTARTYALANMGKRSSDGYDLLPTTSDQVYGGHEHEHRVSTDAVDATAGVVAVHNGKLITTLYHSTSGGWTANSEDVYTTKVPYLRGVPDAERGVALEKVPTVEVFMRNANPTNLRAAAEGDFESDWSRYHRWTVDWTVEEMAEVLSSSFGTPITEVDAVRVVDRSDHGRVQRIEFDTDAGTFEAEKDAIRWNLRYIDAKRNHASLRSTLFFVQPVTDKESGAVTGWKAYGGGWGHGVGMSQTGAVGMAERGRSYQDILRHYYRGIELEQRD